MYHLSFYVLPLKTPLIDCQCGYIVLLRNCTIRGRIAKNNVPAARGMYYLVYGNVLLHKQTVFGSGRKWGLLI